MNFSLLVGTDEWTSRCWGVQITNARGTGHQNRQARYGEWRRVTQEKFVASFVLGQSTNHYRFCVVNNLVYGHFR